MRGLLHRSHLRPAGVGLAACASALAVTACGNGGSYKNADRPASPIVLTSAITPKEVAVSPQRFGAGPVILVVTNQTNTSQRITVARNQVGETPFEQQTSPINPHGTASLKADLVRGVYEVKVDGSGIKAGRLTVGARRASAQNDLLQP